MIKRINQLIFMRIINLLSFFLVALFSNSDCYGFMNVRIPIEEQLITCDSNHVDSLNLIRYKDIIGFKYSPEIDEMATFLSYKYWLYPTWKPTDSSIYIFEDSFYSQNAYESVSRCNENCNKYIRQYFGVTDSIGNKYLVVVFSLISYSSHPEFGKTSNYNHKLHIYCDEGTPGTNFVKIFDCLHNQFIL